MQQRLSRISLVQLFLNLRDEKRIVKELNTFLKDQGCKVEFVTLNLDLIKEGNQMLMLPCCSFQLSWKDTHSLLDYYDGDLTNIFGNELSILPEKEAVQFFIPCKGDLYVDSLQDLKATVERSMFWSRTVLRPLGFADKLFTVSIVQLNPSNRLAAKSVSTVKCRGH
jgi:hypothetical protein